MIFQAGDSSEGRDFAARNADVIFSAHGYDFDDALAFADDIRRRLAAVGRPADDLRILPGASIIIGATEQEAEEKARWVRHQQITPRHRAGPGQAAVERRPVRLRPRRADARRSSRPSADDSGAFGAAAHRQLARDDRRVAGGGRGQRLVAAPDRHRARPARPAATSARPAGLADKFARFVREGALDGFNLTPYLVPDGLDDIVDTLVPALQERGIYRTEYTGTTLREHLGLRETH